MSIREKCLALLEGCSEEQLTNIAAILEFIKAPTDENLDDLYCLCLYAGYQASADKDDPMSLEDFAQSIGVSLA